MKTAPFPIETVDKKELALAYARKCGFILHFNEEWGPSILIMEKTGLAFCQLYWYSDDLTTVYLGGLTVSLEARGRGLGTRLQVIREKMGIILGAEFARLWVKKGTWMRDWYQRRGYEYDGEYRKERAIWMKKRIN